MRHFFLVFWIRNRIMMLYTNNTCGSDAARVHTAPPRDAFW